MYSTKKYTKMAYVYKHTRLDINEPYYIGIGKSDTSLKRAYSKENRSIWWKRINDKVETKVEIIEENLTWEEAIMYEKYYIKLYGRKDLGTGVLVNMTDGGEGTINVIKTEEQIVSFKERMKVYNQSRVFSEETRRKISEKAKGRPGFGKKPVLQFDKQGNLIEEFESIFSTRLKGFNYRVIQVLLAGKSRASFHKDFRWEFKEVWDKYSEEEKFNIIEKVKQPKKKKEYVSLKFIQYDLEMNFIKEWDSTEQASKENFNYSGLINCLKGRAKTYKEYIWKYKL